MDSTLKTVFLLTTANLVNDIVEVETKDFCRLNVKVSYRVNFEGDPNRWFNVDNYVKFMCDHMRSKVRSAVQKLGIEEFYGNHTDILRDIILGVSAGKGTARTGTAFEENGMRIYDVEVLGLTMQNADVEKMLVAAQRDVIQNTLVLASERRKLDYVKESEDLKRQTELARAETERAAMELLATTAEHKLKMNTTVIETNAKTQSMQAANELDIAKAKSEITKLHLDEQVTKREAEISLDQKVQALKLNEIHAQVQAVCDKAAAIQPDLIAALSTFGERAMVEKVAESMAPLSILTGGRKSVLEALQELIKGTPLANQLQSVIDGKPTNGSSKGAHS